MTIYVITSQPNSNESRLGPAILAAYPKDALAVGEKSWLVSSSDNIQEVSKKIGVMDGSNGAAIVTEVGAYFGRANPNIWNWIKSKMESSTNA